LKRLLGSELRVIRKQTKEIEYFKVIEYIVDYIFDFKPIIRNEETISYHSWLLKFKQNTDFYYDVWEANIDGSGFSEGIEYSVKVISEQTEECKKVSVIPCFPKFSQYVVISKGVYEGLRVDAVRYPSPDHMTGWWLTTELYDDNIDSLMNVHYFDLAFRRPDLLPCLALPYGYRFSLNGNDIDIWYDEKVL